MRSALPEPVMTTRNNSVGKFAHSVLLAFYVGCGMGRYSIDWTRLPPLSLASRKASSARANRLIKVSF
jgi:hypothetical protein